MSHQLSTEEVAKPTPRHSRELSEPIHHLPVEMEVDDGDDDSERDYDENQDYLCPLQQPCSSPEQFTKPTLRSVILNVVSSEDEGKGQVSSVATQSTTQSTTAPSESYSSFEAAEEQLSPTYVSFGPLQIQDTLHVEDYTQEEIDLCWYQREEYRSMTAQSIEMLKQMEAGMEPDAWDSYRGLETWTDSGKRLLEDDICHSIDVVLDEQDRQWDEDIIDEDIMAEMYHEATESSTQLAFNLAMIDELEVRTELHQQRLNPFVLLEVQPSESAPASTELEPSNRPSSCPDPPGELADQRPKLKKKKSKRSSSSSSSKLENNSSSKSKSVSKSKKSKKRSSRTDGEDENDQGDDSNSVSSARSSKSKSKSKKKSSKKSKDGTESVSSSKSGTKSKSGKKSSSKEKEHTSVEALNESSSSIKSSTSTKRKKSKTTERKNSGAPEADTAASTKSAKKKSSKAEESSRPEKSSKKEKQDDLEASTSSLKSKSSSSTKKSKSRKSKTDKSEKVSKVKSESLTSKSKKTSSSKKKTKELSAEEGNASTSSLISSLNSSQEELTTVNDDITETGSVSSQRSWRSFGRRSKDNASVSSNISSRSQKSTSSEKRNVPKLVGSLFKRKKVRKKLRKAPPNFNSSFRSTGSAHDFNSSFNSHQSPMQGPAIKKEADIEDVLDFSDNED